MKRVALIIETSRTYGREVLLGVRRYISEKPDQWERQQADIVTWLRGLPRPSAMLACTDQLGFWLLDGLPLP